MKKRIEHPASYKDPAAKVFSCQEEPGYLFRALSATYLPHYTRFIESGLSAVLIQKKYIVSFDEVREDDTIILKTKMIEFISYPYEWSFDQWKDAAMLTLKIQYQALKHGMILKDATPFNILFTAGKPVFVDLSSFEIYQGGKPWAAFKQFCENFYVPLLLSQYFDETANEIYINNTTGISIQKGLSLLPAKVLFNFNVLLYLLIPNIIRKRVLHQPAAANSKPITLQSTIQMADDLFNAIEKIRQLKKQTKWNGYYKKDVDESYLKDKEDILKSWIGSGYQNKRVVDFGCNTGNFSLLISPGVQTVIAFDADYRAVNELYLHCKKNNIDNVFCFYGSISNPAPFIGWNNEEHLSLVDRLKGDLGIALALVHHLAITYYIQFDKMADFFATSCQELLIEFVPKEDDKVQLLLKNRVDVFYWYTEENFLYAFQKRFRLFRQHQFFNKRTLFHFSKVNEA